MKEYIVQVEDDDLDDDELFVGYIRQGQELIRCENCVYCKTETFENGKPYLWCGSIMRGIVTEWYFCASGIERKEE